MITVRFLVIRIPLYCPYCGAHHVDESRNGERWDRRGHTTHRCQSCGSDFDVYASGMPDAEDVTKDARKIIKPEEKMTS